MKKILTIFIILTMISTIFVGCKKEEELTSVAIIDDTMKVSLNEALFYVFTMQKSIESQYGPEALFSEYSSGRTFGDMLKEEALNQAIIINMWAYVAEKQGITLEEDKIDEIKQQAKGIFEALDPKAIEENSFSLELVEEVLREDALRQELLKSISDKAPIDEAVLADDMERLAGEDSLYGSIVEYGLEESAISVRVKHILLLTIDAETNIPLPEEEVADAYERAGAALERAKAGEDFETLVAEYSQDPGSANTGGELSFARGEFVEFETAAYDMEPGEISDIIETEYGYHIIKLEEKDIPPTEEQIAYREDYVSRVTEYAKSLQNPSLIEDAYSEWEKEYAIEIKEEIWNDIYVKGQSQPDSTDSTDNTDNTNSKDSSDQ